MPFKDKQKQREAQAQYQRTKTAKLQVEIQELKESSPCTDCKRVYPYYVMDFDHVRGEKKERVNRLVQRGQRKAAYIEIEKCELVCSNCHRERTHQRNYA